MQFFAQWWGKVFPEKGGFHKELKECPWIDERLWEMVDEERIWPLLGTEVDFPQYLNKVFVPDHLTCLLRNLCGVKKQQLELDMEQQTGSKLGKEYVKAVYCSPAYLIYMPNTSCKMLGWMKHKLESRLPGEISMTSDMKIISPLLQKVKRN